MMTTTITKKRKNVDRHRSSRNEYELDNTIAVTPADYRGEENHQQTAY